MQKLAQTLDLDALRSFVTGMECGSFAGRRAALSIHFGGQRPAEKLEQQCGSKLVVKRGVIWR